MVLKSKHQKGFGLVIALLLVALVAGVLSTFYASQSGQVLRREAEIAAWEGAEIARAARIHSRNQIEAIPNLVTQLSIAADGFGGTGPEVIAPNDLITSGLLPSGFARNNGANFTNALGQTINIYLANYPIAGDPNDPATVPTAYVLFLDNITTNPILMQDVVAAIRTQDVAVSAPIFDGGGNNISAPCAGEDAVAFWDSGCLSVTDYDLLVDGVAGDASGDDVFAQGSFIIPAWRSVSFDTRAMMRFPQPEQTGVQTMLTNLTMAEMQDCDLDNDGILDQNFVVIPSETGTTDTAFCSATSDDDTIGAEIDNRRSIVNVNNIDSSSALIVNSQAGNDVNTANDGTISIAPNEAFALNIGGIFTGTGDASLYGSNTRIAGTLITDKNIRVTSSTTGATVPASASVASLNTNNTSSTNFRVINNSTLSGNVAVANSTDNINTLTVNTNLSSEVIMGVGASPVVAASQDIKMTNVNPTSIVIGTASPSTSTFFSGIMDVQRLGITGSLNVGTNVNFGDTVTAERIDVTNGGSAVCRGECPRRRVFEECTNLQNISGFPFGNPIIFNSFSDCLNQ